MFLWHGSRVFAFQLLYYLFNLCVFLFVFQGFAISNQQTSIGRIYNMKTNTKKRCVYIYVSYPNIVWRLCLFCPNSAEISFMSSDCEYIPLK